VLAELGFHPTSNFIARYKGVCPRKLSDDHTLREIIAREKIIAILDEPALAMLRKKFHLGTSLEALKALPLKELKVHYDRCRHLPQTR